MKSGIINTLIFYVFGFSSAWVIYLIFGHPYIHAPGLHHIAILLTFLLGLIWAVISTIIYFAKNKTEKLKGIIITNLVLVIGFIIFMTVLI